MRFYIEIGRGNGARNEILHRVSVNEISAKWANAKATALECVGPARSRRRPSFERQKPNSVQPEPALCRLVAGRASVIGSVSFRN
jgi:hypothetical protein